MSKKLIGSINLNNVQKDRLIKGEKGNYYSIEVILHDEPDEYGNLGMVVSGLSKEEREKAKETKQYPKFPVLGNIKFVFDNDNNGGNASSKPVAAGVSNDVDLDLPF